MSHFMLLSHRPQGRTELMSESVFVFASAEMYTSVGKASPRKIHFLVKIAI